MIKNNINSSNIIFVLPSFAAGGAERILITLMNNLDNKTFYKELIVVNGRGHLRDLVLPEIPICILGQKRNIYSSIFQLFKQLKKCKPDIVVSTMAPMNFVVLLLRPFFPKTRFIIREAITPSFFSDNGGCKGYLSRWGYRLLYPMADIILSPSQTIIDELKNIIGNQNYRLILNSVNVRNIRKKASERTPDKNKPCVKFLCSGRLHTQKGFDRLIAMLPNLNMSSGEDWRLSILGEGEERKNLETLVEHSHLKDKITLVGHLENPWPYMAHADCFLLPSRWEGMPNVVLEALACGTIVIATKESGGIAEIAKHTDGNNLIIADTMKKMIESMSEVTSYAKLCSGESMLPACFQEHCAIEKFTKIILENLQCSKNL